MTVWKWIWILCASSLLPVAAVLPEDPPDTRQKTPTRVPQTIAIGDVHGDYGAFIHILESLGLVEGNDGHWIGGKTHLVQTGDLVDRGPDSRRVIELLMRLEREAREAGGRVTVLLGNHEAMNLTGDLYYVTPEEYASFASDEEPQFRKERKQKILSLLHADHSRLKSNYYGDLGKWVNESNIDIRYPPGYFAHRRAFSRKGAIGRWLLKHDVFHVEKRCLFVHGGLSPRFAGQTPEEINHRIRTSFETYFDAVEKLEELAVFDSDLGVTELQILIQSERQAGGPHPGLEKTFGRLEAVFKGPLFSEDGPLWYRGLAENDERLFSGTLRGILRKQRIERIVIGHTQHPSLSITGRFGNRVILIDTGMNRRAYGGRPSALVIRSGGNFSIFEAAAGK